MRPILAVAVVCVFNIAHAKLPSIDVWYGDTQSFGDIGNAQRWINILGHVSADETIASLTYKLNGGAEQPLSFQEDFKRIATDGDFNIEIARSDLRVGENSLLIVATNKGGEQVRRQVKINYSANRRWPLPYEIDWSKAESISDVAQVVDGKWQLSKDGVRSVDRYYDRVIAFGDETWTNYEVTTSVTVHGLTPPREKPNTTGVTHAAIALRWPGHDADGKQPSVKWYPVGATAELRFGSDLQNCRWRIFDGKRRFYVESNRRRQLEFDRPYRVKHRVESLDEQWTKYSVKLWPNGSDEPADWDLVRIEEGDLKSGSALLIAHHSDVTFGNVRAAPLQKQRSLREMNKVATPPRGHVLAITEGTIIDGNGGAPIPDGTVLIRGNRIAAVGRRDEVKLPDDCETISASGKTVLPGLLDSHFHSRDSVARPVEYELHNGITSFRDPGHPFKYYAKLLSSGETVPRVFLCGGHLDSEPVVWPDQAKRVASPADAIAAVNENVLGGASAIKVYFRLPLDCVQAACLAAAKHDVPVTSHLELVDADKAILAGVKGVEHITSFGTTIASDKVSKQFREMVRADSAARKDWRFRLWASVDLKNNPKVDDLLQLLVDRGVFVSPTLAIFESRLGDEDGETRVAGFQNMLRFFHRCYEAGAPVVVGSHTSAPFAKRGKAYLREMQLMVQAGMKPIEVITAATKTNAKFFGVEDRLGTLEPGKLADMIVVDGNPAADIDLMDHVEIVVLNGRVVVRN